MTDGANDLEVRVTDFKPIKKENKSLLDPFFKSRYYENSYSSFFGIYLWHKLIHTHWAIEDGALLLTLKQNGRFAFMQPYCPDSKLKSSLRKEIEWARSLGQPFRARGVEGWAVKTYLGLLGDGFVAVPQRDEADYLYATEDLINLSGRKYHSKKNHIRSFWRSYPDAEYLPITGDIVPECKLSMNMWYKAQEKESPGDPYLATERFGVMDALDDLPYFGLKGGALRLGKRIIAFTIGERINDNTAVIFIEKATPDVRGAYPVINQAFLENEWADTKYVNRQEDMGLDGLRQAKESYHPVRMIEKFNIMPRGEAEASLDSARSL